MAMQSKIRIPNNWAPRRYQRNVWGYLERGGKRAICIWHRRAGKDEVCLHWAASSMIDKPATYWHMLPAYSQGRKAIWTAVNPHTGKRRIDEAFPHELRANTNDLKNGATWQVLGSDRYDAAVGSPPYGITFSEWALSNPAAWAYLAPIVIENSGWALFITTARGRNHAKTMLDMAQTRTDWFSEVLPVNVTGAMSEEAVEQQRLEYTDPIAPDQWRTPRQCRPPRGLRRTVGVRFLQPVAHPRNRRHREAAANPGQPPDRQNATADRLVDDRPPAPATLDQLATGNHLPAPLRQRDEDLHDPRLQNLRVSIRNQLASRWPHLDCSESKGPLKCEIDLGWPDHRAPITERLRRRPRTQPTSLRLLQVWIVGGCQ